jgi:hypothetical protein
MRREQGCFAARTIAQGFRKSKLALQEVNAMR